MLKQLFESFYNGNIEVIAKRVAGANTGFHYTRNLDGVYEEYLNQRTALRYLIKSNIGSNDGNNSILLDGHKVAACITCAIIKVRLITASDIEDSVERSYSLDNSNRLNEQVALLCGLSCLLEYMFEEKEYLFPAAQQNHDKISLIFPQTKYHERSTYLDSLVRGLYYSNLLSTVNPLLLSHIFFMIEQYHRKCVELEDLKNGN